MVHWVISSFWFTIVVKKETDKTDALNFSCIPLEGILNRKLPFLSPVTWMTITPAFFLTIGITRSRTITKSQGPSHTLKLILAVGLRLWFPLHPTSMESAWSRTQIGVLYLRHIIRVPLGVSRCEYSATYTRVFVLINRGVFWQLLYAARVLLRFCTCHRAFRLRSVGDHVCKAPSKRSLRFFIASTRYWSTV